MANLNNFPAKELSKIKSCCHAHNFVSYIQDLYIVIAKSSYLANRNNQENTDQVANLMFFG